MINRKMNDSKKAEDYPMRIRDAILLYDDDENRKECLKYIEDETRLLMEKGRIADPAFLLKKGSTAKGIH